ncbi:hypothetical protein Misp06_00723 [Microbulbifer sp. NBRC 101763]|uniref:patatin-like phospholipase family protein n=1 Tax=Microbulbifer TaxID=48073 RepID=UPI0003802D49|nr:patatin-like phospholipase family protein [Microbulbifer variabilis]
MFEQMVLGGGGGRCTWQLGFLMAITQEIELAPKVICAASGGAMVASFLLMERCEEAADYFHSVCRNNQSNIHWNNLISDEPVFPHFSIYKKGVNHLFSGGFERLCAAADLRVSVIHPPSWLPSPLALATGIALDHLEKQFAQRLHPTMAFRFGFRQMFYGARDCSNVAELEHLILSSCCNPPLSPRLYFNGEEALDGGVVGNAPVAGLDAVRGRVLILDAGHFANFPTFHSVRKGGQLWTYVQPSQALPISVWEFSDPEATRKTLEIGRADGQAFLKYLSSEEIKILWGWD